MSENPRALRATRDAFLPLGQDGFDRVTLREGDKVVDEISWPDVEKIVKSCNVGIEEAKSDPELEVEVTPAWLSIYSPVFDSAATSWRFRLGKEVIYADILQTNIEQQALTRGHVGIEDAYLVRLEITTEVDRQGNRKDPRYKVLEVTRFVPGEPSPRQTSLLDPH